MGCFLLLFGVMGAGGGGGGGEKDWMRAGGKSTGTDFSSSGRSR